MLYRIIWKTELTADSPLEAAVAAQELTGASSFLVRGLGEDDRPYLVDLEKENPVSPCGTEGRLH